MGVSDLYSELSKVFHASFIIHALLITGRNSLFPLYNDNDDDNICAINFLFHVHYELRMVLSHHHFLY